MRAFIQRCGGLRGVAQDCIVECFHINSDLKLEGERYNYEDFFKNKKKDTKKNTSPW
ncbi:MAG: hypothetical protein ACTJLM_05335 [Ehrlichia sp.]